MFVKMFIIFAIFILLPSISLQTIVIGDKDIPELADLDTTVDPCEDFYQYTCGNFDKNHKVGHDEDHIDHFVLLEKTLTKAGIDILSTPKDENEPQALKKAKAAYAACVNTDYIELIYKNIKPPEFRIIDEWGGMPMIKIEEPVNFSWNDIGKMTSQYGVPLLFDFKLMQQLDNTEGFFILITADPLTKTPLSIHPNQRKSYDEILEEAMSKITKKPKFRSMNEDEDPFHKLLKTITTHIIKAGNPDKTPDEIQNDLHEVLHFWEQLQKGGIVEDNATIPPFTKPYPTLKDLQIWTESAFGKDVDINWTEYFKNIYRIAGVDVTENITTFPIQNKVLYGILNLVRKTKPSVLKNFALLRVFLFLAPDSTSDVRTPFEEYLKSQNSHIYSREEYCARKVLDTIDTRDTVTLSFAIAYYFQHYYFDHNKHAKAVELVDLLRQSLHNILTNASWMDEQSRSAALKKADDMLVLLGYPDFVEDTKKLNKFYRNMRICDWDNYGNAQTIRAFKKAYINSQLGKPRTRNFWDHSTFDTNAYYNRGSNKIVLPIAMLHAPYFQMNKIVDLSRIGSIIGHEFTHGFDSEGQKYDKDGIFGSWWTNKTQDAFNEISQCFVEQYSNYYIQETGSYVNGNASLNENLADNGGLRGAYLAFLDILKRETILNFTNYTVEQLFFIGYGTSWCSKGTLSYHEKYEPKYAPHRYRVNGPVSNLKEFSKAFNCKKGSPMNPVKKCKLW